MIKGLVSVIGLLALSVSVNASADHVYEFNYGRWHLNGYADYNDADNNACVLSTEWADGKTIKVNIFPKYDGSANVTMTVLNPEWSNPAWRKNQAFNVDFTFTSNKYGVKPMTGYAQIYSQEKVIFRRLNNSFAQSFIRYDDVTIFQGTQDELFVSLEGTAALANDLDNCVNTVLGQEFQGGNY